jgi:hypothetical protein
MRFEHNGREADAADRNADGPLGTADCCSTAEMLIGAGARMREMRRDE